MSFPTRSRGRSTSWFAIAFLLFAVHAVTGAHDGIHIDIDRVTAQIDASETPRADLLLVRARLLRFHGKPELALADCDAIRRIIEEAPGTGPRPEWGQRDEPLERALCLVDLGREAEASPLLDSVIEAAPARAATALDARATLRERSGDRARAIADATRSFGLEPTVDRALRRGGLLVEHGALETAARAYREAIETLGDSLLVTDALISVEIARGEYERALALIDAELARAAVRTTWLLRRAEVFAAAGNEERRRTELRAALAECDRVLARRRIPMHLVTRGRVLLALGDLAGARRDAEEARRLAPEFRGVIDLIATIEARTEDAPDRSESPDEERTR